MKNKIAQTLQGNRIVLCVSNDDIIDYSFDVTHTYWFIPSLFTYTLVFFVTQSL